MQELPSLHQVELLRSGRLDACLVSLVQPPTGLESLELYEDRFVICLPPGHPLVGRDALDIALLRHEPFVQSPRERAPTAYDQAVIDRFRRLDR